MAVAVAQPPPHRLLGTILYHSGLGVSRSTDGGSSISSLQLRLVLQRPRTSSEEEASGVDDDGCFELDLRGYAATKLHALQPGDRIEVEAPEVVELGDSQTSCCWQLGPQSVLRISRGADQQAQLDSVTLAAPAGTYPEWLRLPPPRMVDGAYKYPQFLCTLRDGIEINLFAIMWENAKPGLKSSGGRLNLNVIIVDMSLDRFPCHQWSKPPDMPTYSLQMSLPNNTAAVPFLVTGDVIRVHRSLISGKPPNFINVRMQKFSSMLAFEWDAEEASTATDPLEPPLQCQKVRKVTVGDHTLVTADHVRAGVLRSWVRSRLERESVSSYLKLASELGEDDKHLDLVVQVLRVQPRFELLVVDGSTENAFRIDLSLSQSEVVQSTAAWVCEHVRPGFWLKIRAVIVVVRGELFKANPATVTRLPPWCHDVAARRPSVQHFWTPSSANVARGAAAIPVPTALAAAVADTADVTEEDSKEESAEVIVETKDEGRENEDRAEPAPAAGVAQPFLEIPPVSLSTVYVGAAPTSRIRDVRPAMTRGVRCHVLGNFVVTDIVEGASGTFTAPTTSRATPLERLLCARCRACGHSYPWNIVGTDVRAAKKRRKTLPCGHWSLRLEFHFRMCLRDIDAVEDTLVVTVADVSGDFFGVAPETAVTEMGSPGSPWAKAQELLDAMLGSSAAHDGEAPVAKQWSLAVYRVDGQGTPAGAWVVCDTSLRWKSSGELGTS